MIDLLAPGGGYIMTNSLALNQVKTENITFLTGGVGVLCYGLTGAGIAPAGLNYLGAWALLIDGLVGFYTVCGSMLGFLGHKPFPLGKPFFKS